MMQFKTIEDLKQAGFTGFQKVKDLRIDSSNIPQQMGVYMVVRNSQNKPSFLEKGSGGYFKRKDPNVSIDELERNWIEGTCVVYIGKAGGMKSDATLRKRIGQYLRFGDGGNVGHYGGRYIWQLADHQELLFCWKPLTDKEPEEYEQELIDAFRNIYGERPFANLK